ncbi:hypothetical protein GTQ40_02605 [Flavobacteriaceae bacterium R38]|nr:hypothetical protein [Flavobacteriaceae bacterium R38]
MITFLILQKSKSTLTIINDRLHEGGFFIMSLILICGLISLFLIFRGFLSLRKSGKNIDKHIRLINAIGLFVLVLGVFGQLLKLIVTLDNLHFQDNATVNELAGGLKYTMLPTLFGCFFFLVGRFFTIILSWLSVNK